MAERSGHVHPTHEDGVVAGLSEVVGGPVGSRAASGASAARGRHRFVRPLALLLLFTACTFALGLMSKTSCVEQQWRTDLVVPHNEQPDFTRFTHGCASDIATSYANLGFAELAWPWSTNQDTRARYGVTDDAAVVGLWQSAAARLTHVAAGSPDLTDRLRQPSVEVGNEPDVRRERVIFVGVNALGLAGLAILTTAALASLHRRRPWDAAGFALAPVLAFAGIVSWDLIAVAAGVGAVWAWSRHRLVLAGILVGVGAAAGVWPAVLLLAFAFDAVTRQRGSDVVPPAVCAMGTWGLLNAPAFLSGRNEWEHYFTTALDRPPEHGSLWAVLADAVSLSDGWATWLSWFLLAAWVVGVMALAVLRHTPPRVEQTAFLLVAGVVMLKLNYEPQHALWLLAFAAVARPRWRDLLIWQSGEVFFFAMHWWWLGGLLQPGGNGQAGFYWIAVGVRLICTGWLVAMVLRDVWHPWRDVVRATTEDADAPALAAATGATGATGAP